MTDEVEHPPSFNILAQLVVTAEAEVVRAADVDESTEDRERQT